jgi:hypothetical protein
LVKILKTTIRILTIQILTTTTRGRSYLLLRKKTTRTSKRVQKNNHHNRHNVQQHRHDSHIFSIEIGRRNSSLLRTLQRLNRGNDVHKRNF